MVFNFYVYIISNILSYRLTGLGFFAITLNTPQPILNLRSDLDPYRKSKECF